VQGDRKYKEGFGAEIRKGLGKWYFLPFTSMLTEIV
jgi:hypothetical protein